MKSDKYNTDTVKALVENLDVMTSMAKYMSEVINQIARALAVIYLESKRTRATGGEPPGSNTTNQLDSNQPNNGRKGHDSDNQN